MAEKKIRSIEIEPAENGGHTVTHRFKEMPHHSTKEGMGMRYVEPEHHVFGPEDGHEMLAHIANHLGIKAESGGKGEEREVEEEGKE